MKTSAPPQNDLPCADLSRLNTFGLRASANRVLRMHSPIELPQLAAQLRGGEWLVLGGGSNVVLPEYYAGTVVLPQFLGIEQLACEQGLRIKAFAGESWHGFVTQCTARGWWGLENLALIPGTVGAAPIQNIGAYGLEVAQRIESVTVWDCQAQTLREIAAAECGFGYRDSVFKRGSLGKTIVVAVTFLLPLPQDWRPIASYADVARALNGGQTPSAQAVFDAVIAIRRAKLPDPSVIGNAGSFFKNPVVTDVQASTLLALHSKLPHYPQANGQCKLAAAWLIDQCGFKGRGADLGTGKIGVHPQQALVLVNLAGQGKALAQDVRAVVEEIQTTVNDRFGIWLEVEPIFVT